MNGIVALVLSASAVVAQQPDTPKRHSEGMAGREQMSMMMMDSLNHRLDSLVDRMNRANSNQKVQAMAAVINELVNQRKVMQDRMYKMMERGGMMDTMGQSSRPGPESTAKPDSTVADTTDHSAHHPPN